MEKRTAVRHLMNRGSGAILEEGQVRDGCRKLIPVLSKTMERMINAWLYHNLEQNACLDESQSGFRRHRMSVEHFTQCPTLLLSLSIWKRPLIQCGASVCM
ncbi:hypothetical protein PoB_000539000 [Plakobranchus ocellatus]|uniref:Reverse transcriptase domain-containing protein n=1 Tax=Plakobranchus ocellatus TaxID=259542 RepID=A0AAV3Y7W5_9GAST|nr:hypothetical protein PoB_000539000 [Plakobranchus ocellatus]